MELSTAIELIRSDEFDKSSIAVWADLGCGSGLFTNALLNYLHPKSTVYAIDQYPVKINHPSIVLQKMDFITADWELPPLDGILMANSLHFVEDKRSFLRKVKAALKPNGTLLLVEYDTDTPNHWVPFPASFSSLKRLLLESGFKNVHRLQEQPSIYGKANLYAAWIN
ncbi:methyltransferase domain-containing protein [Chitinophaga sp. SYP-B3965]|uniref:class I SAM-dependent methyltransferase n=1 Tax=Chitinophaga sp. SYP-B3965 TaxID=2663120 RepID=UPI001299F327|nr:class I SAM-dependent methyltransferase [Chitinophaga sp. SYP-B3965]MRG47341.1 methyltransferase domain-containing protein [Chitinophaga sp. SYP-B3965]